MSSYAGNQHSLIVSLLLVTAFVLLNCNYPALRNHLRRFQHLHSHRVASRSSPLLSTSGTRDFNRSHSHESALLLNKTSRFMFYAGYGQLNNQVVSLVNALFINRRAGTVLVLPYTQLGKESVWDIERAGHAAELARKRQLVGAYFNYSHLRRTERVVLPTKFFPSPYGRELLLQSRLTVSDTAITFYDRLFMEETSKLHNETRRAHVTTPKLITGQGKNRRLNNVCDLDPNYLFKTVQEQGRNGRFILFPKTFRRHNLNCTHVEPDWISIRKSLVPRDEYLLAVDTFMKGLPKPVLAIHLRIFLSLDLGQFTADSYVDMLFRDFGDIIMKANSLYVAYSQSSDESREVFDILGDRFHGKVIDGSVAERFYHPSHRVFAKQGLAGVLFDMWVCVRSRYFLGRLKSSLSWNVVFWRQAFQKEYGLDKHLTQRPLWYSLENFTTTGAQGKEGHLVGSGLPRKQLLV